MTLSVGLAGLGRVSHYYLQAIAAHPEVRLLAVCDVDEAKLRPFTGLGVFATTSFSEMVSLPSLDAIIVLLPHHLHSAASAITLRAGKHLCCEKPLASTVADAEELASIASANGVVLMTAFHRRYNRPVLSAQALLNGRRVVHAVINYKESIAQHSGPDSWYLDRRLSQGGCIADNGTNAIAILDLFIDAMDVDECVIERSLGGIEMAARLVLRSGSGATAEIFLEWDFAGEHKDITLLLSDGTTLYANMLEGSNTFKASLSHEYHCLVADFTKRVRAKAECCPIDLAAVKLICLAYSIARDGVN